MIFGILIFLIKKFASMWLIYLIHQWLTLIAHLACFYLIALFFHAVFLHFLNCSIAFLIGLSTLSYFLSVPLYLFYSVSLSVSFSIHLTFSPSFLPSSLSLPLPPLWFFSSLYFFFSTLSMSHCKIQQLYQRMATWRSNSYRYVILTYWSCK